MKQLTFLTIIALLALALAACAGTPTAVPAQPTAAVPAQPATAVPTSVPPTSAPTAAPSPTAAKAPAAVVLKLEGLKDSKSLTLDDLKALPVTEGWAGIKSSTGKITLPAKFKGVAVDELFKLVGGLQADTGVNLAAKDGYAMTSSYDQISKGDFITYDPSTGDEIKLGDPLKTIIAYEEEGKPLPEDTEGPLRLVVVSAKNNQVVDGHWSVRWITQASLKSLAQDWKITLMGALSQDLDRGTFQSCAAPSCHGKTWTDDKAQVWSGVPLWMLIGAVDDTIKHGEGSYNEQLATQGYQIEVVAADGFKATFDSVRIKRNDKIIVAFQVNNNPLDEKDAPLKLVGADLTKKEMVGQIAKIHALVPMSSTTAIAPAATVTATVASKSAATSTPAPAGSGTGGLTITGAVEKEQTLTLAMLKAMPAVQIQAEHPKKGMQNYTGVKLNALLDQAKIEASATKLVLLSSDGFKVQLDLAAVRSCANCLLAFNGNKLDAVMPGMESSFWAKDVVKVQVQ